MRFILALLASSVLGLLYSYLYYESGVRDRLSVPVMAAFLLIVLPASAGWFVPTHKWISVPASIAVAWAVAFFAAVSVWKDGL